MGHMTSESAKWRVDSANDDAPVRQPMKQAAKPIDRRQPSADQKRVRRDMARKTASVDSVECDACGSTGLAVMASRGPACSACGSGCCRKIATKFQTNVATADGRILLNAGDQIQMPTGQTLHVKNVRRHETSRDHYYVDTDAGTSVVPYSTAFNVVPSNANQEALPGMGTPGGNFNHVPLDPQAGGGPDAGGAPTSCPACGSKGSLNRRGGKYQCTHCGYTTTSMGAGMNFSDATQQIMSSITNPDLRSAVARRAAVVLAASDKETQQ